MSAKRITTPFLHPVPPEGPHTVTVHVPQWDQCMRLRDGDQALMFQMNYIYPRFHPIGHTKELCTAIHERLAISKDLISVIFVAPDAVDFATKHATSEKRGQERLFISELTYRAVDIHGIRLYVLYYPAAKALAMVMAWQNPGLIISTRLAKHALEHLDELEEVSWAGGSSCIPSATWLPESWVHQALKERICSLINRAAIVNEAESVNPNDVFLHQTGMAAIYRTQQTMIAREPGTTLVLGAINHNTFHLLRETRYGFKHFGAVNGADGQLDDVDTWLHHEHIKGRAVSFCFLEFPSNPLLVSVDLCRLRQWADMYNFVLVIDDTIGSFSNIDIAPAADVVITSLTKTFSGYANVMGGSAVLIPSSPRYTSFAPIFRSRAQNELFADDAIQLLENNADYLTRSTKLNANAAAMASYLHSQAIDPASPITIVMYPPYTETGRHYAAFLRRSTSDFTPGYGCLLSVELETLATAKAFFDNLHFHGGPHLGAHRTLAIPFNATVWDSEPEEYPYHVAYGLRPTQIRISAGLEDVEELIDTLTEACRCAKEAKSAG